MKKSTFAATLIAAAGLPLLAGCASHEATVYQPPGETIIVQHRTEPPPVPTETIPPQPDTDDVWIPGQWQWHYNHWAWEPGHWQQPSPGHVWARGHWERSGSGYVWIDGHWE